MTGGDGTGHDPFRDQSLYESRIPELLLVPWLAYGAGVQQNTRLDEVKTMTGGRGRGRYVNIMDTAPTVLHALGIAHPPGYICRGATVFEAFRSSASDVRCLPRTHFCKRPVFLVAGRSASHTQFWVQQVKGDGVTWWVLATVFITASCVGVCIGMRAGRKYQPLPTQ